MKTKSRWELAIRKSVVIGAIAGNLVTGPYLLAQTLPYPANSTFFTGDPPSLVSADTPDTSVGWPYPHYYFTFNIPSTSPQSVGQVSITPDPNSQSIAFDLSKTVASQGTSRDRGGVIPLKSVTRDPQTGMISIAFANPVPPNTTFTLTLQPYNNPDEAGTYLFRLQVYPAGTNPIGLDLGVGRFSFYQFFR
jgi:hypothetical protein